MSKQEIVDELQGWIADESFAPNRDRIDQYNASYKALKEETLKAQLAAFINEREDAKEDEFDYKNEPEDIRFEELVSIYHDKRKALDKQRREKVRCSHKFEKSLRSSLAPPGSPARLPPCPAMPPPAFERPPPPCCLRKGLAAGGEAGMWSL